MTDAEVWVLDALQHGFEGRPWLRPMDIGRPSSFVCRGLTGLEKKGLVESKRRGASTAKLYRLTEGAAS